MATDAPDVKRINGKIYDFGSVILKIDGIKYEAWKSIKYSQKRERVKVGKAGRPRTPLGLTRGKPNAENLVISMLTEAAQELRDNCAKKTDGVSYGDHVFPISLQRFEPGKPRPQTDEFFQCAIVGDGGGVDDNGDPEFEDVEIMVSSLKRDGKTLY